MRLPNWIWGGNLAAYAKALNWKICNGAIVDEIRNVQLVERTRNQLHAGLIQVHRMAHRGNLDSPGTFARLKTLPPHDHYVSSIPFELVQTALDNAAATSSGGLGPDMWAVHLAMMCNPEATLASQARDTLRQFLSYLPDSEIWLLTINPALTHRFTAPRVLILGEDDPEFLKAAPPQVMDFASSRSLVMDTTIGLYAYLAPLLLSLAPYVWGMNCPRVGGVIIYVFGAAVPGVLGHAAEPVQIFKPLTDAGAPQTRPSVTPSELASALTWWINRLDVLFSEIADPCNYRDTRGCYVARRQFEKILSIEQAFRNVQSLSTLSRDGHAQRVLLMDTLDTLAGAVGPSFDKMCQLRCAEMALRQVEEAVPAQARNILVPRARRAVDALRELQTGFFLDSRVVHHGVRLPDKNGSENIYTREEAAALWLRVLRNAGHAFGGKTQGRERDEALLLAHDARVPQFLPDLAYLYILRLLARPEMLRRHSGSEM